jgi:hypothetical protein
MVTFKFWTSARLHRGVPWTAGFAYFLRELFQPQLVASSGDVGSSAGF